MSNKTTSTGFREYSGLILALLTANGISVLLFVLRAIDSGSLRYYFLIWNLLLAWLPLLFVVLLAKRLKTNSWLSPTNIILTLAWFSFLPNSFYLVSDLIHLQITSEVSILYDAVLFASFIFTSYLSGFMSLYIVHVQLLKRLPRHYAHEIIAGIIFVCSFAIYLGRSLRWNTWDAFLHPNSLLFDVSEQVVNRAAKSRASVTTLSFFLLLGGMYLVIWQLAKARKRE